MKVPTTPEHLALLRTVVGYCAGRENFTIDQIDDLKMAVDETGVQLLRRSSGDYIELEVVPTDSAMEIRVSTNVNGDAAVIDPESFSWTILQALADELGVDTAGSRATVSLHKYRLSGLERRGV